MSESTCACATKIKRVLGERRRLEKIIWERSYDNLLLAANASISTCTHADAFAALLTWVNATFFYDIYQLEPRVSKPCHVLCNYTYSDRARRFFYSFVSYATAIRMVHVKHMDLLKDVANCCNSPLADECALCLHDFSAQVFTHVNAVYFDNLARIRHVNVPNHIVKAAQGCKMVRARVDSESYKSWQQRRLAAFPAARAPAAPQKKAMETREDVDDIEIQFLY